MISESRNIKTTKSRSIGEIPDLLESLFVLELIAPSHCIWIVSAWLTNIEIVDNRAGNYSSVVPDWGATKITFVDVLTDILNRGTSIVIATNNEKHNTHFYKKLRDRTASLGVEDRLSFHKSDTLHIKGILTDSFYLNGSMNFTQNGVTTNEEELTLTVNQDALSKSRLEFRDAYGGALNSV